MKALATTHRTNVVIANYEPRVKDTHSSCVHNSPSQSMIRTPVLSFQSEDTPCRASPD